MNLMVLCPYEKKTAPSPKVNLMHGLPDCPLSRINDLNDDSFFEPRNPVPADIFRGDSGLLTMEAQSCADSFSSGGV